MVTWIRENAAVLSLAASVALCVSTIAVARYQLQGLVSAQAEVRQHIYDSQRHLDPHRDPESMKEMKDKIERLERHIERLERRQIWMIQGIRNGVTTSIPMLIDPPQ